MILVSKKKGKKFITISIRLIINQIVLLLDNGYHEIYGSSFEKPISIPKMNEKYKLTLILALAALFVNGCSK